MKTCKRCQQRLFSSMFYKHSMMADGRLNICIECTKRRVLEHRQRNIERIRAYDRERAKTPKRRLKITKNSERWRRENPERYKAHTAVHNAIRDGRLHRQPCENCGETKVHAHHDDYEKPLEVRWLCAVCHSEHHANAAPAR